MRSTILFTGKGDDGKTRVFDVGRGRIGKDAGQIEALGSLDELNSFLGLVKVKSVSVNRKAESLQLSKTIEWVQDNLFTIQAEVAGAKKKIMRSKIGKMEKIIARMNDGLPEVRSFLMSGGTELSAMLDISRTLARKVERRIIGAMNNGEIKVGKDTIAFLNRLSSLLYVMVRWVNHISEVEELHPSYK